MANAKRPGIPVDATPIPPALNHVDSGQVHDNKAPFSPAPVEKGEHDSAKGGPSWLPEEGTGKC